MGKLVRASVAVKAVDHRLRQEGRKERAKGCGGAKMRSARQKRINSVQYFGCCHWIIDPNYASKVLRLRFERGIVNSTIQFNIKVQRAKAFRHEKN